MSKLLSISKSVKKSLLSSLYRARKRIEYNKDIYIDTDHKTMCEYYNKYQELQKKFNGKKTKVSYNNIKIDKHLLSENHDEDEILFIDNELTIDLLYNEYNENFINKIYVKINPDKYTDWINKQNLFIKSLTPEEIYTLRCHTHDGDVIVNYFIKNNFNIYKKIDDIDYHNNRKSKIIFNKKIFNSNREYILFYYQIKKYLYEQDVKLKDLTRMELEEYIKKNYYDFEWDKILMMYISDINNIFIKCPNVNDDLVFYRGVYDDYYIRDSKRGSYETETLSSATLNYKVAVTYADRNCCIMRIKAGKGSKVILIDNLSNYNEYEVLFPFGTKFFIDYPRHQINFYKTNEICPDETKSKKMMVTDLSVITSKVGSLSRSTNYATAKKTTPPKTTIAHSAK